MNKPAARLGDDTAHGGKIVEGDTTVLIGDKPAARIGDDHTCPRTGHRGGPVLPPCAPMVLIGGRPAARIGDKLGCGDTIVSGENTVVIGAAAAPSEQPAPAPEQDWVDLHYNYADGEGVPRARYVVQKGKVEVARGKLDDQGRARVKLPVGTDKVTYYFDDDPEKYRVYPEHRPQPSPYLPCRAANQPVENERSAWEAVGSWVWGKTRSAVEAAGEALESSGEWVWGVLRGDFNEDASMGQIVIRGAISFLPLLGTALDVQDVVAAVYFLVWKKRYKEALIWFMLVVTLLGCIPIVGDAGKLGFKLLKKAGKGAGLDGLLRRLNAMGKGNAVRWLKELSAGLPAHGKKAAATFRQILDDIGARLIRIKGYALPRSVKAEIDEVLAAIEKVRGMVDEMFTRVVNELKSLLDDVLGRSKRVKGEGPTRTELTMTQDAELKDKRALGEKAKADKDKKLGSKAARMPAARKLIDVKGTANAADADLVAQELSKMPLSDLEKLDEAGYRVVVCRNSVTEYRTDLSGVTPRGWPASATFDDVPGLNAPKRKETVIAVLGHGTPGGAYLPTSRHGYNLPLHELSHGVDHLGSFSSSDAFRSARAADSGRLTSYFKQGGKAGAQETYAEASARYYGGDPSMKKDWPSLYGYFDGK